MNQTFEKIGRSFYRRQYQASEGDWRTYFYAVFTDWKSKRRRFPLGENIERARNKLGDILKKNDAEFDFDKAEAEGAAKEMTFRKWASTGQASALHVRHLNEFLVLRHCLRAPMITYRSIGRRG